MGITEKTIRTGGGSPGELAISVSGANGYLFSQRNAPSLQDFYVEATLKTNLCRDGDTFGLLLRTNSFQDYYRWAINCDGYERLERVRAGTVGVLQDWLRPPRCFRVRRKPSASAYLPREGNALLR